MEDNKVQLRISNDISLKEVSAKIAEWVRFLLSKWILILLFGILGGVAGYVYARSKSAIYTAITTFVLEEASGNSLGQYEGVASMIGINLGGGGGGLFQGDNLIELYKSRQMIERTLMSKINVNGKRQLLIERFKEITKNQKENSKFKFHPLDENLYSRQQDSLISSCYQDIINNYLEVSKPDKKLNIFKVEVKSSDEQFSKCFNDQIVKNVNDFYVQTKTKKSLENIYILQHQADSIRKALNGAITGVANSIDANPNANLSRQILRVPSQKRNVDIQTNSVILAELVKNLEISKISLRKETPLIQTINYPVYPLQKDKVSKLKMIIIGGFLLGSIAVIVLLIKKIIKDLSF